MSTTENKPKVFHLKDVKEHKDSKSAYLVIYDKVYDITKFLEEHPGGEEVLLEKAGQDATDAFEDVGHSTDARELMKDYEIGDVHESEHTKKTMPDKITISSPSGGQSGGWTGWLIPLGVAIAAALLYRFIIAPTGN